MDLAAFREQYPQYNDMPDEVLSGKLRTRFYSDLSGEEFARRMNSRRGLPSSFQEQEPKKPGMVEGAMNGLLKSFMELSPIRPAWVQPEPIDLDRLAEEAAMMTMGGGMKVKNVLRQKTLKRIGELQKLAKPEDYMPRSREPLPDIGDISGAPLKGEAQEGLPLLTEAERFLQAPPRSGGMMQDVLTREEAAHRRTILELMDKKGISQEEMMKGIRERSSKSLPITPDLTPAEAFRRAGGITDDRWFGKAERKSYSKAWPGVFKLKDGHPLEELAEPLEQWAGTRLSEEEMVDIIEKDILKTWNKVDRARRTGNVEDALDILERDNMKEQLKRPFTKLKAILTRKPTRYIPGDEEALLDETPF